MTEFGPLVITAHNREQAAYLVRSRAEQRGVAVGDITVADGNGGMWLVTMDVAESDLVKAATLADDTKVLHIDFPAGGAARA